MKSIALQPSIVYGPVRSRRLGWSLGLNSSPIDYKLCSFNCIYCQYGWTSVHSMHAVDRLTDFPAPDDFAKELESMLCERSDIQIENITFSGNGEPTLHPQFGDLVDITRQLRDRYCSKASITLLSNSSTVNIDTVQRALQKLDYRIMKLDAGTPQVFERINRPCSGVDYETIVDNLKSLDNVTIQTMFVDGTMQNVGKNEVNEWCDRIGKIEPLKVQIYSLHRPPAASKLREVSEDRLKEIAIQTEEATGVTVEVIIAQNPYSKRYNEPYHK